MSKHLVTITTHGVPTVTEKQFSSAKSLQRLADDISQYPHLWPALDTVHVRIDWNGDGRPASQVAERAGWAYL
jgi:hypothetical protein